jgi:ElaB/YqjD/DUF883 family membrane-anchored ribosome-binding protein
MSATELHAERVIADLKRIVRDSEALLQDSADAVGDKARDARQRLSEITETARNLCRKVEEKGVETLKATDRVIRDHPYQSIGIAAAVGLLIGVLVTRK